MRRILLVYAALGLIVASLNFVAGTYMVGRSHWYGWGGTPTARVASSVLLWPITAYHLLK